MSLRSSARGIRDWVLIKVAPTYYKERHEIGFWRMMLKSGGTIRQDNDHYRFFYNEFFKIPPGYYVGKKLLDIGCGPCGSLEWADEAAERIGLDPLAEKYRELGIDAHKMKYVTAPSEKIPFDDNHFDCVFAFNSLDHVEDADKTISEIKRVLKSGGLFLLIVELNHPPTATEPVTFDWDIAARFEDKMNLVDLRKYEKGPSIYHQLQSDVRYDESRLDDRSAIAAVRFTKK